MKIVAISDTHNVHDIMKHPIPDGDVIIHAGDATNKGSLKELNAFAEWFRALPHKHKIYVPGNHDMALYSALEAAEPLFNGIHILIDKPLDIDGKKFYGTPWLPNYGFMAFMLYDKYRLELVRSFIPEELDVLICHGPPHGILDMTYEGESAGCEFLLQRLKIVKPKVTVFGHIHYSHGSSQQTFGKCYNVAICGEDYRPDHPPTVFEI